MPFIVSAYQVILCVYFLKVFQSCWINTGTYIKSTNHKPVRDNHVARAKQWYSVNKDHFQIFKDTHVTNGPEDPLTLVKYISRRSLPPCAA